MSHADIINYIGASFVHTIYMIVRNKDGSLESVNRKDFLSDDSYYVKYAILRGVIVESPNYGSVQMNRIIDEITNNTKTSNAPCIKTHSPHKPFRRRSRGNSLEN